MLAVLAACGGKPTKQVVTSIANTGSAAPVDDEGEPAPEGCESAGTVQMRLGGRPAQVELVVCDTKRTGTEEQQASGFVTHEMVAQIVWHAKGERPKRQTIKDWTNGWEWGDT